MLECLNHVAPQSCLCYPASARWTAAPNDSPGCVCPDAERALRAYMGGHPMPPMTPAQREECLEEIAAVEGYDRHDYETVSDSALARGVLSAWVDFCRDKGLL